LIKIHHIIQENKQFINPAYREIAFESVIGKGLKGELEMCLYIPTKFRKLPNKKYCEEIRKLFSADECFYVPKMSDDPTEKPFWCVKWRI